MAADVGTDRRVALPQPVMPGWSLTPDGTELIAELTGPLAPRALYRVPLGPDPEAAVRLGMCPAPLPAGTGVPPELHHYRAPDGTPLQGWWYPPAGTGQDGRPAPAVVAFHGGPESQERPAFSILAQALAAAGIGVFAPNVRGSSGYGRRFLDADDGARRPDSFQDVPATVAHLVSTGLASADRIGVQGWSYGGYLALTAVSRWPELFAAAVTHAGMSDLLSFFAETEPWMAAASVTEYGDPGADADLLRAISPLTHQDRVRAPTLLVHGAADTNVPVGESVRAHAALRAAGVPTELLLLPGEGHTVVGEQHRIRVALAVTGWFVRWLVPHG
ncbi:alpha/beta fold hydrolase [Nakamurella sp. YIM 132087]|uniref:Alpha/beta fold hydrolase n=2 Tax=Nakamurella alba TaxID=2665158 RepID=A0A7K1FQG1_9ACTN|nr:alpha/beta fold hydrolase [Nakamurella alba]